MRAMLHSLPVHFRRRRVQRLFTEASCEPAEAPGQACGTELSGGSDASPDGGRIRVIEDRHGANRENPARVRVIGCGLPVCGGHRSAGRCSGRTKRADALARDATRA